MPVLSAKNDYRVYLREEYEDRCKGDPSYTLKAFASDIGLSAPRLSELLAGKQGISVQMSAQIARKIGLSRQETLIFCDLVESLHARSRIRRESAKLRLNHRSKSGSFSQLDLDRFKVVSDWFHFALLSLTHLKGFQSKPSWIAKALSISEADAEAAIERLKRVGMLKEKNGRLYDVENFVMAQGSPPAPSDSIKKFHSKILKLGEKAMYEQEISKREYLSSMVAIRPDRVPAAKKAIQEFNSKFLSDVSRGDDQERVYCLAIQFFDVAEGVHS